MELKDLLSQKIKESNEKIESPLFNYGDYTRVISKIDINMPKDLSYWLNSKCVIVDIIKRGLLSPSYRYELYHLEKNKTCEFDANEIDLRFKSTKDEFNEKDLKIKEIQVNLEKEILNSNFNKEEVLDAIEVFLYNRQHFVKTEYNQILIDMQSDKISIERKNIFDIFKKFFNNKEELLFFMFALFKTSKLIYF